MTTRTSATTPRAAITVACLALFTDMLVYGIAIPVLPLLPATVAAGPAATGLLFAGYAVATLAVTPVAGRLVDRAGPRRPLLYGMLGLAAATLLFAFSTSFALLVLARVLQGVAAGMSWIAGLALIAASTPIATRGRSMGLAMSMVAVGVLVGPPVGGFLAEAFGPRAPFLVAAALALADGIARYLLVRADPPATDDVAGPLAVIRVPGTVSVLVAVLLGAGALAAIEPVLPLHLQVTHGLGPLAVGGLFAVIVLTSAVLNPLVGSLVSRVDARALVGAGGVLAAGAMALLGLAGPLWLVVVAMMALGAANALLLATATTLIGHQGERAQPPALGGSYAAFNAAYACGMVVGPVVGGAVTGAGGFAVAAAALAVLTIAGTAGALPRLPTGR
ncbi:MFS transporter [Pseudonocardia sp. CA-107938]|uniref:MFS transporter n=1 Tax=Pseudonocardia sp. CA-107938 TaxID=3240021 RepID=UPI003D928547